MLKALFLDMDETLCDTQAANAQAKQQLGKAAAATFSVDGLRFAEAYVKGIYREWTQAQQLRYMPIIEQQSEGAFRVQLIADLLAEQGIADVDSTDALILQEKFDADRLQAFNFYPGMVEFLAQARKNYCLVVITNGPVFSQVPKVEKIQLAQHVDHIIIGGQEPEQKPARSIFAKALKLASCEAHEAIHIGDSLAADIAGANNSGISSIWIQHQQSLDTKLGIEPNYTVQQPSDISALIQGLE